MRRNLTLWLALGAIILVMIALLAGPFFIPAGEEFKVEVTSLDEDDQTYARTLDSKFRTTKAPTTFATMSLALIDGLTLWTIALFATATLVRQSVHARVRSVISPLFYLLMLVVSVIMTLASLAALFAMLTLFLAAPFGTIVYLIKFGSFGSTGVMVTLGFATLFRFAALICLLLSSWRFLKNKTLIGLIATGYVLALIAGLVFGILPGILHAIVDAGLAIIFGIVAAIWSVILLVRSIPGLRAAIAR